MVAGIQASQRYYDVGVVHEPDVTIVTVSGEMDLFAAPALAKALTAALDERPQPVIVDLCDCTLFESSGLNALLTAHLAREAEGRIIVVRRPRSCADRTLSLTVPGVFAEHDTRETALAAIVR